MTQTTTPDNIPSPDLTDQYALTQDMAALAGGVQLALDRRANLYKGTSTQRAAFTTAPEGTHWQDTNGTKELYVRKSGQWVGGTRTATSNFLSPILPYTAGNVVTFVRNGNIVQATGTGGVANATSITGSTDVTMANIPAGFRPSHPVSGGRMQGTGSDSWYLSATTAGQLRVSRYSGTGTNIWLPFQVMWMTAD